MNRDKPQQRFLRQEMYRFPGSQAVTASNRMRDHDPRHRQDTSKNSSTLEDQSPDQNPRRDVRDFEQRAVRQALTPYHHLGSNIAMAMRSLTSASDVDAYSQLFSPSDYYLAAPITMTSFPSRRGPSLPQHIDPSQQPYYYTNRPTVTATAELPSRK